jgi:hypothetical protein
MRSLKIAVLAPLLALLTACGSMGVPKPETFNEGVVAAYSAVTSARTVASTLLSAGKITRDDAINIQRQADRAREAIDVARALHDVDSVAAQDKLSATIAILQVLNDYLASRQL